MVKVLIVDDNPSRYNLVTKELSDIGVLREEIKFVHCSNDASRELGASQYDLLILDILIPAWPDSEADRENSADLLFSIHSDDSIIKPKYIVGITSDPSMADETLLEFEKNMWTVINYSPSDEMWVRRIVNCVKYLMGGDRGTAKVNYCFDLAVVCALKTPEFEQVTKLPWHWGAPKPLDDVTFYREGVIETGGKTYRVAAVHASRMGMVSAAILTNKVIERLRPKVIAMTGICAAHKSQANLGDVVVADPAWDFQSGKLKMVNKKLTMEYSPHQIHLCEFLRGRFDQMTDDPNLISDIIADFGSDAPSGFKLRIGPVASGASVLADGHVIDEIKQFQNRDLIGLEMEIYGVYAAAQQASFPQPRFLAIKGVCDFADAEKHDGMQRFAAFASAQILSRYVNKYSSDIFSI